MTAKFCRQFCRRERALKSCRPGFRTGTVSNSFFAPPPSRKVWSRRNAAGSKGSGGGAAGVLVGRRRCRIGVGVIGVALRVRLFDHFCLRVSRRGIFRDGRVVVGKNRFSSPPQLRGHVEIMPPRHRWSNFADCQASASPTRQALAGRTRRDFRSGSTPGPPPTEANF